jgi:hypothetical protein
MMIAWYHELNSNGHPNRFSRRQAKSMEFITQEKSNLETVCLDVHGWCTDSLFLHVFVFKLLVFELFVV